MASKKKGQLTKHCRIYQWVEGKDSTFAEAIRETCLEGALSAGGRSSGVTFLYPNDPAYRQEIVDKVFSDNIDEGEKMISALIIPDLFTQASEFSRRSVGNRNNVALPVESVSDGRVRFANGLEITPAKFTPLGDRSLAVWLINSGRAPLEGKAYSPPEPQRRPPRGARTGGGETGLDRARLAAAVEAEFDTCQRSGRGNTCNPYLAKVVSLLNFLRAERPDLLEAVLPVLDYDPFISFYLLLEPYKTQGEFLIPSSALFGDGAWNGADAYSDAVAEFVQYFEGMTGGGPGAPFMYRDLAAVESQIDVVRQATSAKNPRQIPQALQSAYSILANQNSIQGMSPVMPAAALRAPAAARKMWQDEFRFTVHDALQQMRSLPYNSQTFHTIAQGMRDAWPGNNYAAETMLTNADYFAHSVSQRTDLILLGKFVNSTDFLYLPVPAAMAEANWGNNGSMSAADWGMYNRNAVALANLRAISGMARPDGISPQAMQELRIYVKAHGNSLPPAVASLAGQSASA